MKRNHVLLFTLLTVLCLLAASCSGQPGQGVPQGSSSIQSDYSKGHAQLIDGFRDLARQVMKEDGIQGLSVALADEKGILWAEGFGVTDMGGRPVDADTIFSVQSISKTFTASAVMQAAHDGLLDLDKPITDYLPEFTVQSVFEDRPEQKMTLRHLLSNTAGFTHDSSVGNNNDLAAPSFDAHIRSISDSWLRFPVGTEYGYSNLGFDLAAYILQKEAGMPFAAYVDRNLTAPAGMANSTFDMTRIKANANRAAGHTSFIARMPVEVPMVGGGGFYASAADMARFIQYQLNHRDLFGEMYVIPFPQKGQTEGYALGVVNYRRNQTYYINHNGGGFGFSSSLVWYPELGVGVAVLANSADSPEGYVPPFELAQQMLDQVIRDTSSVYYERSLKAESPPASLVDDNGIQARLTRDVASLLMGAKGKPVPDTAARKSCAGLYGQKTAGLPFFSKIIAVTEQNGDLLLDGSVLNEMRPGVFVTGDGETLDMHGAEKSYSSVRLHKLALDMNGAKIVLALFLLFFVVSLLIWPVRALARRLRKKEAEKAGGWLKASKILQAAFSAVSLFYFVTVGCFLAFIDANGAVSLSMYGIVGFLVRALLVVWPLILLVLAALAVCTAASWIKSRRPLFDNIYGTAFTSAGILFLLLLSNLNLLVF